jgi:hypothetical protein
VLYGTTCAVLDPDPVGSGTFWPRQIRVQNDCAGSRYDFSGEKIFIVEEYSMCRSVVVRQEIRRDRWKKSTKTFELKMRKSSFGIIQSYSNRSSVQIISYFNSIIIIFAIVPKEFLQGIFRI